jgi:AAA domain
MAIPNINDLKFDDIGMAVKKARPSFTILYSAGGVGKSTISAYNPNPVILPVGRETGAERCIDFGIPCFENTKERPAVEFVFACMAKLLKTEHNRKTLIMDNLGTYREAVDEQIEDDNKGVDLNAFGKRQALAYPYYTRLLAGFDLLMKKKAMNIVLLAHSSPINVNLPNGDYYQTITIHAPRGDNTHVVSLLEARAHNVLYLKAETQTRKIKGALGVEKTIGSIGNVKRMVYTRQTGLYFAKSRGNMQEAYEITETDDPVELLKDRSNESIIKLWADVYGE